MVSNSKENRRILYGHLPVRLFRSMDHQYVQKYRPMSHRVSWHNGARYQKLSWLPLAECFWNLNGIILRNKKHIPRNILNLAYSRRRSLGAGYVIQLRIRQPRWQVGFHDWYRTFQLQGIADLGVLAATKACKKTFSAEEG